MCQNTLFSAVFPIFCSFPLYQLSGLHFREMGRVGETVAAGVIFQHGFLVADGVGFPIQFIV